MKNKSTPIVFFALIIMLLLLYFSSIQKKTGVVDFTTLYKQASPIEVAGFEQGEGWQGNFTYDNGSVLEGKTSIIFSSWYGKENTIVRNKQYPTKGYGQGYVLLYIKDGRQLESLTHLTLALTGDDNQTKEYEFKQLAVGWNRLTLSIPTWNKIISVRWTILSKPNTIAEVNLDRFWIEKKGIQVSNLASSSSASSLRTIGERVYFFSASDKAIAYQFPEITSFRNGTVTLSLIPEHAKTASIRINSTEVMFSTSTPKKCTLLSSDGSSQKKLLTKTQFENDIYTFIKITAAPGTVTYSISNNGIDYEECGKLKTTKTSALDLSLEGSYLLDGYSFSLE